MAGKKAGRLRGLRGVGPPSAVPPSDVEPNDLSHKRRRCRSPRRSLRGQGWPSGSLSDWLQHELRHEFVVGSLGCSRMSVGRADARVRNPQRMRIFQAQKADRAPPRCSGRRIHPRVLYSTPLGIRSYPSPELGRPVRAAGRQWTGQARDLRPRRPRSLQPCRGPALKVFAGLRCRKWRRSLRSTSTS